MQYSDGYKENTYLTWKGEKYRVTPKFESLSFYDERDGRFEHYGWNSQDNANYENFILALIRFEESLDDKEVLDKSYAEYMKNDFIRLLNNEFDYMIDELRKSG